MTTEELPTVVVAYGAADVPESWTLVADALAPRFRVVVPRRVPGIDPVAQLAAVIDAQEQAPIVVGHSYGGLIARAAIARSVHRAAGLVLVDATSSRAAASRLARTVLGAATLALDVVAGLAVSPLGRFLITRDLVQLTPEQRAFRRSVGAGSGAYEAWRSAIVAGIADGTAANEMEAVIPAAAHAAPIPAGVPIAVVHSDGLTRRLERPAASATRRVADVTATGDRFHNIHLVHPEAIAAAVLGVASAPQPLLAADGAEPTPVRRLFAAAA
jgi:pimeloyl-ACP methyl ester carboxylesterase